MFCDSAPVWKLRFLGFLGRLNKTECFRHLAGASCRVRQAVELLPNLITRDSKGTSLIGLVDFVGTLRVLSDYSI